MANPNDFRWSMRALLLALNRWVADGKEPPPSRYPRVGRPNLTALPDFKFPKIPGCPAPGAHPNCLSARFRTQLSFARDRFSGASQSGQTLSNVSSASRFRRQRDCRHSSTRDPGATGHIYRLELEGAGAWRSQTSCSAWWDHFIPFARSKAERLKQGDPRPSIEERYPSRQEYLAKVKAAAHGLEREGYLLESDIPAILTKAGNEWDYLVQPHQPSVQ